jgi:hypothetical protein
VSLIIVNAGNVVPAEANARAARIATKRLCLAWNLSGHIAAGMRPIEARRRYPVHGLT